jgi:hypothetical protein
MGWWRGGDSRFVWLSGVGTAVATQPACAVRAGLGLARGVHLERCRFEIEMRIGTEMGRPYILQTEDIMKATKKAKAAKKAVMHKGKSLEAVKPLTKIAADAPAGNPTETVSFHYGGIQWSYGKQ